MSRSLANDRFQVCCSICGFLESYSTFVEALSYAKWQQKQHNSNEERIEIFDAMAHFFRPNLWDTKGNVLKRKARR